MLLFLIGLRKIFKMKISASYNHFSCVLHSSRDLNKISWASRWPNYPRCSLSIALKKPQSLETDRNYSSFCGFSIISGLLKNVRGNQRSKIFSKMKCSFWIEIASKSIFALPRASTEGSLALIAERGERLCQKQKLFHSRSSADVASCAQLDKLPRASLEIFACGGETWS